MTEWYYARGGQQSGPVSFEQLSEIARSGGFDPMKDLVWTASMKDWVPVGQVRDLFAAPASPEGAPAADPANPYAAPQSALTEPAPPAVGTAADLLEIAPGSEPIEVGACVRRGIELTKRQFGSIMLVGLVYFGTFIAMSLVVGVVQGLLSVALGGKGGAGTAAPDALAVGFMLVSQGISQLFSMFLGLGLTRVGLNLVSGKEVRVGMLFGEGGKLLRVIGATILFGLMVGFGFLLLIVPGIYLALKYGQYMVAIVDRDLGVFDAFKYCASLTTNNRLNLLVLGILAMIIVLAGMLACGVGLIFAGPVAWLSYMVAYRWMQYGSRATLDHPGTTTPLLADV
jgi:uncharacterized membrane protein